MVRAALSTRRRIGPKMTRCSTVDRPQVTRKPAKRTPLRKRM